MLEFPRAYAAFGASTAPFDALDKAFKRDLGFEASIGVRLVTQAQCPAIKFLSQIGGNQARAPRINLNSVEVKNGETLTGTIENFANRIVELLILDDALERLTRVSPRQGQIIELRYFGGLTVEEIGDLVGVSPATISRDQKTAEAWLAHAMSGPPA